MRNDIRERTVRLLLLGGTMRVSFTLIPQSRSDLTIRTPHGELNADSDCILLADVDNRRTRVTCVQGIVTMRVGQSDFSIEAGYFQEFPSTDPSPGVAADDAQAQRDMMSMIQTEDELQALARRQRLSKPAFFDR